MSENSSLSNQSLSSQTCCYEDENDIPNMSCCNADQSNLSCCFGDELYDFTFKQTLPTTVLSFIAIAIACASVSLNSSLLWAISRVERTTLRAKHVIQSLSVANLVLPLVIAIDPILLSHFIHYVLGGLPIHFEVCFTAVYAFIGSNMILIQPGCAVMLSLDRVYSLVRPITYKTVGYPKYLRVIVVMLPWLIVGVVSIGALLAILNSDISHFIEMPEVCAYIWTGYTIMETANLIDITMVITNSIVFLTSIVIFLILKYRQAKIVRYNTEKNGLTMVITYFLINLNTLILYLPAPLYSISVGGALYSPNANQTAVTTACVCLAIYLLNTCIDPIILIYRIRSIRKNLPFELPAFTTRNTRRKC